MLGRFVERKQADELIRALARSSTIGIYVVQEGTFRFANPQFQQLTGYSEEELLGTDPLQLILPEDRESVRDNAIKMLKGERSAPYEYRFVGKAGEIKWILETVTPVEYDGARATFGNFMDITDRKRAEEEHVQLIQEQAERVQAEAAHQRISNILESMSDAFIAVDIEGRFTYINKQAEQFLQGRSEELLGKLAHEEFPDLVGSKFHIECEKALSEQRAVEFEAFYAPLDVWLEMRASPSENGLSIYFHDITKRKRAEQFREEYIHNISHDLRSPLTIIRGHAQMIQRAAESADLVRRSADSIATSAQRMHKMIQDLTDSTRLEAGQLRLNKQPVNLCSFASDLLERATMAMDAGRVKLQLPSGLPSVLADPDHLERILTNLITNAQKYSPPETEVLVRAQTTDEKVTLSVTDRGIGIAATDLPHIFERFYRCSPIRRTEGLGLGLYITKMLVEAHGERIWVESEPGSGSVFSFTLPVASF
ncbi:MAG: PAS domain-containing sensor histidine kinase [Chloroflexota bacterium]|nr:MAG: PAS domain-containing sensor histidine kinase [Chloroflexota bacterium]